MAMTAKTKARGTALSDVVSVGLAMFATSENRLFELGNRSIIGGQTSVNRLVSSVDLGGYSLSAENRPHSETARYLGHVLITIRIDFTATTGSKSSHASVSRLNGSSQLDLERRIREELVQKTPRSDLGEAR
jgi:hypothetical protein